MPLVSVIIPTLNEERRIGHLLAQLSQICPTGELIVVDANSSDRTAAIARQWGANVYTVPASSRGHQLRVGVSHSHGRYLWFLHADVTIVAQPRLSQRLIEAVNAGNAAACLRLAYHETGFFYRFLAGTSNWRARHLGLIFGDQGLFVTRRQYDQVGGFPDVPLMEDWLLSKKLRRRGAFCQLPDKLYASARKYMAHPWRTHLQLMWIKLLFICGVSPQKLAQLYYRKDHRK